MSTFLNTEQEALAQEIASLLIARGQTVAVAEATTGGLVSAALLWVAGASATIKAAAWCIRWTHASPWPALPQSSSPTTEVPPPR